MAKKSSETNSAASSAARDIARVAQTGKESKSGTKKRSVIFSFSSLVVVIIILGIFFVGLARATRDVSPVPRQNEDHWHAAYSVWDCVSQSFLPHFNVSLPDADSRGIHSHDDSVIHIHPHLSSASGKNAKLEVFLSGMGAEVTKEAIVMPATIPSNAFPLGYNFQSPPYRLEAGVECDGEPAIITIRRWRDINNLSRDPIIYDENFDDIRFLGTGEVFVIARAPRGFDVPTPPDQVIQNTHNVTPDLAFRPQLNEDGSIPTTTTTTAALDPPIAGGEPQ